MQQPALGELAATQGAAATVHMYEAPAGAALPGADGADSSAGGGADQQAARAAETAADDPSSIERLPSGLLAAVLRCLPHGKGTLACARVSRRWAAAAVAATSEVVLELSGHSAVTWERGSTGGYRASDRAKERAACLSQWLHATGGLHVTSLDVRLATAAYAYTRPHLPLQLPPLQQLPALRSLRLQQVELLPPAGPPAGPPTAGADGSGGGGDAASSSGGGGSSSASAAAGSASSSAGTGQASHPTPLPGAGLSSLELADCKLTAPLCDTLGPLSSLKALCSLELSFEPSSRMSRSVWLTAAGLGGLPATLTRLRVVGARRLALTEAGLPALAALTALAALELDDVQSVELDWLALAAARSLTRLRVAGSLTSVLGGAGSTLDAGLAPLSALCALRELELERLGVAGLDVAQLPASLTSLDVRLAWQLRLAEPADGDAAAPACRLRRLVLSGVAGFDPRLLRHWPDLQELELAGDDEAAEEDEEAGMGLQMVMGGCEGGWGSVGLAMPLAAPLPVPALCGTVALLEALPALQQLQALSIGGGVLPRLPPAGEAAGPGAGAAGGPRPEAFAGLTASPCLTRLELAAPLARVMPAAALRHMLPGTGGPPLPRLRVLQLGNDVRARAALGEFPGLLGPSAASSKGPFDARQHEQEDEIEPLSAAQREARARALPTSPLLSTADVARIVASCPGLTALSLFGTLKRGARLGRLLGLASSLTSLVITDAELDDSVAEATLSRLTALQRLALLGVRRLSLAGLAACTGLTQLTQLLVEAPTLSDDIGVFWLCRNRTSLLADWSIDCVYSHIARRFWSPDYEISFKLGSRPSWQGYARNETCVANDIALFCEALLCGLSDAEEQAKDAAEAQAGELEARVAELQAELAAAAAQLAAGGGAEPCCSGAAEAPAGPADEEAHAG